jgi:hypothetical protein
MVERHEAAESFHRIRLRFVFGQQPGADFADVDLRGEVEELFATLAYRLARGGAASWANAGAANSSGTVTSRKVARISDSPLGGPRKVNGSFGDGVPRPRRDSRRGKMSLPNIAILVSDFSGCRVPVQR